MVLAHAKDDDRRLGEVLRPLQTGHQHGAAAVGLQRAVQQVQRLDDHAGLLVVLDGDGLLHGGVGVEGRVPAGGDGDLRQVLAAGAELVHVALGRQRVARGGCEMPPGPLPVLIAPADGVAGRGVSGGALARVHAQDRVAHAGLDGHDCVLHHGDGRGAAEGQVGGVDRRDPGHVGQPHRVAPVGVVQGLVGEKPVHRVAADAGVVETLADRLQVQRMGRRFGPLAHQRLAHPDDGVFSPEIGHGSSLPGPRPAGRKMTG